MKRLRVTNPGMEIHQIGKFQNKIVLLGKRLTSFQESHFLLILAHISDSEEGYRRMGDNSASVCTLFDPTTYFWTLYKQTGHQKLSPYGVNIPCQLETFIDSFDEYTFPYTRHGIPHTVWQHIVGMLRL